MSARAWKLPGQTPIFDHLLAVCASAEDPISGGRHKVFGSRALWVAPQTSTIASHLPKAVGAAVTGLVMLTIAVTKFAHGAWIVLLLIPTLLYIWPRTAITRRTSRLAWCGSRWIGMKSCTSPTPSAVRNRVIRTFVSGK